jgi:crotonobetainyl-CoA:carnitine CoA-transferase CaiB-like acyl-CoA transferase
LTPQDTGAPTPQPLASPGAGRVGPLARFRVLDLTRVRSGPTAVRQLADWGADVIKIESPPSIGQSDGWDDRRDGADFQNLHRNKRSLTLNLKHPQGLALFRRLVREADVVVENYRPDVKQRLGIDYTSLRALNPRIVLASISGFGQSGPYAQRPGFDQIAQGMGGLMAITGDPEGPPMRAGCAVSDSAAGLYCAMGILTALLEREQSGEGQWIEVSLLNAMIALLDFQAARYTVEGQVARRAGNDHPTVSPTGVYRTADGYMNVAAGSNAGFAHLCEALERPELATDPRFATLPLRVQHREALNALIESRMRERDSAWWNHRFAECSVAGGPIHAMDQVFADPQVQYNRMAEPVTHPRLGTVELISQPFRLSRTPHALRSATPECGQHTDDILSGLGCSPEEIARLRAAQAI